MVDLARTWVGALRRLPAEERDVVLYGASAVFAFVTGLTVGIPLYRQWGQMAAGPYAAATVLMVAMTWWIRRRGSRGAPPSPVRASSGVRTARVVAFVIVLFGATLVPLGLEVVWRTDGNAALHVQPEVVVVEHAGARAAHGEDPYRVVDRNGHVVIHQTSEPTYELYYPYLPGMVLFGLSTDRQARAGATDARIQFLVFTVLAAAIGLARIRPRTDARTRAFQVLTVLPTAALPFVTGGDDMPVVGFMLLGLVALQRRRPFLAGLALGAASSLKFTAWPLLVLAAWAAFDLRRRRSIGTYVLGAATVIVPVVVPLAFWNPAAFVDNVVRFPLGLAGVSSPAASALPGHILIALAPGAHRAYVVVVGVLGCALVAWLLARHPPGTASEVARFAGWVMLVGIMLAPATRVGYLLYPINLFVWTWMLRRAGEPALVEQGRDGRARGGRHQLQGEQPGRRAAPVRSVGVLLLEQLDGVLGHAGGRRG